MSRLSTLLSRGSKLDKYKAALQARIEAAITGGYTFTHWRDYDYTHLNCISYIRRAGRSKDRRTYNDCIIMGDTETSKKDPKIIGENHVVAWTISIRAYGYNICTLWGHRPSTMMYCLQRIMDNMFGDKTIIYFHNLTYDWTFLRRFFFKQYGFPERELNTKPHYPIYIEFSDGLILKDSLILAQRSLDKWAKDLGVTTQKAVGSWDYDKIRNQKEEYTEEELKYIEHDTLAGVECLDVTRKTLKKHTYNIPLTATGIVREGVRERGRDNRAREWFKRVAPTYEQYVRLRLAFHGGYTHANRHYIGQIMEGSTPITCYDYASDYPYCMLAYKYPRERFHAYKDLSIKEALEISDQYAIIGKLVIVKPRLKDDFIPMPCLQVSKCYRKSSDTVCDNGRILASGFCVLYVTEYDLKVIQAQYDYDEGTILTDVEISNKDYLPRWFRDYVFELFKAKTELKPGGDPASYQDPVLYQIRKGMLNSTYGMSVQSSIREEICERYDGDDPNDMYYKPPIDEREEYKKYLENRNNILPYWLGVWTTSIAFFRIFELGACIKDSPRGEWLYTDTDSCFAVGWDEKKLAAYNEKIKSQLLEAGYGPIIHKGREYWLGVAEKDKVCNKFVTLGAKRYAYEDEAGEIKITVAGVPKKGKAVLEGDLSKFKKGLIFPGEQTGKKLHTYFYHDIYTDKQGNETGDSIDLSPADYTLDDIYTPDWTKIWEEDISVAIYDFDSIVD